MFDKDYSLLYQLVHERNLSLEISLTAQNIHLLILNDHNY